MECDGKHKTIKDLAECADCAKYFTPKEHQCQFCGSEEKTLEAMMTTNMVWDNEYEEYTEIIERDDNDEDIKETCTLCKRECKCLIHIQCILSVTAVY